MKEQALAISAELMKMKRSRIVWITFAAFAIAPVMGSLFMVILQHPDAVSGMLKTKSEMMSVEANWPSYLGLLSQSVGIGGVLIFGFVASWLFGREYSDGTAKDLLALPISRAKIIHAKFICYLLWCFALAFSNLFIGLIIGWTLQLPGWEIGTFFYFLREYLITTFLIVVIGTPIALFALIGRGYLAPLGFVVFTLVLAQIIGAVGLGSYFPWAVPGLYSGAGGEDFKMQLDSLSFTLLFLTSIVGYLATILWWKFSDQE